ncbi:MAG: RluA family pseudouridine synthase [Kiritimatiellaceae bacterium]|nr:RluA family pseudouridine synthase [Kiritimatiellaceae bacterium]
MSRATFQVTPHEDGLPLVDVLSDRLRCSKKQARVLLDARQVFVNGQRVWMAKHTVKLKDVLETVRPEAKSQKITILSKMGDLFVVNKPSGVVTNGSARSLEVRLQHELNNPQVCAVHRLDRDTSGCVLFAANAAAKEQMIPLFKEEKIVKIYRAIAIGRVPDSLKTITRDIDGESATTIVSVLDRNRDASYLELRIHTGRTHQIRKHLAAMRHPVLGDKEYAGEQRGNPIFRGVPRQMLHACRLILPASEGEKAHRISAPVPEDFQAILHALKLK